VSRDASRPSIHVVAAAITDASGRVLIAQRPAGKHLAGGWEFPGGKLEPGEERLAGLARELREELGITIATPRPLIRVRHAYPSREVLLDIWVVTRYRGEPQGLDGQALRWCTQDELATADLLPADKPIVGALRLPERLTEISTRYYSAGDLNSLESPNVGAKGAHDDIRLRGVCCVSAAEAVVAADAAADFVVLRKALPPNELMGLCHSLPVPVFSRGIELEQAWVLGSSGLNEICT
jgi:mutator protein MutT